MQRETLDRIALAAQSTANLFRLSMEGPANETLVEIVDGLAEVFQDAPPEQAERLGAILSELVSAQERGDSVCLADLLEFELLPPVRAAATQLAQESQDAAAS